jgi:hypothetical protein
MDKTLAERLDVAAGIMEGMNGKADAIAATIREAARAVREAGADGWENRVAAALQRYGIGVTEETERLAKFIAEAAAPTQEKGDDQ